MHVAPHEDFARIAAGLEACLDRITAWEGMVYRSAAPRYSSELRLEGLLVPSHVARAKTNLIAFPDNLLPASLMRAAR